MLITLIIYCIVCGTCQPAFDSTSNNDFCDRDYHLDLNEEDAIICNAIDIEDILYSTMLLESQSFSVTNHAILWKDKAPFLVIVYLNKNIIYADVFEKNGGNVVSNHVVLDGSYIRWLLDIEILNKRFQNDDFLSNDSKYEDITDFMVIYRSGSDKPTQYTLCSFDGNSITNVHENKAFNPPISKDDTGYMEGYSSAYLYNSNAFILFGWDHDGGEWGNAVGVIILNLNGDILNQHRSIFIVDSHYMYEPKLSCGFNTTHDICAVTYSHSSQYMSYQGSQFMSIKLSENNDIAYISIVNEISYRGYLGSPSYWASSYTPVIIGPEYNVFFIQDNAWNMKASMYDLYGNVIIETFKFTDDDDVVSDDTKCYGSYKSHLILCIAPYPSYRTFIFDMKGNKLIDRDELLPIEKLNNFIKDRYRNLYHHIGDINYIYDLQIIPLISNDFWIIYDLNVTNINHNIIFAVKISLYDICCDIYFENNSEIKSDRKSDDKMDIEVMIAIIVGVIGGVIVIIMIIIIIYLYSNGRKLKYKNVSNKAETRTDNIDADEIPLKTK